MRIASLLPSATEIVYALGLDDSLVGVTFECDYPPEARVRHRTLVGGTDTQQLDPATIDQLVHDTLAATGNLYQLDESALRDVAPDVILTQDLCRVCAIPSSTVDDALDHIGCSAQVVSMDPMTLEEVFSSIIDVAVACGVESRGHHVVDTARQRLAVVTEAIGAAPQPRVFVLEWIDPPFLAGHWVPDVVRAAGGLPVLSASGSRSFETTWEQIEEANPDVVIVAPCGFGTEAAAAQAVQVLDYLPSRPQVWAVDANAYIVRPSHRLVDGVEVIAGILHPDRCRRPDESTAVRLR